MIKKVKMPKKRLYNLDALDFSKEEKWLNEMASKGLALKNIPRFAFSPYEFEECEPDEYVIRVEPFDRSLSLAQKKKYVEFLNCMGVEIIHSDYSLLYVRKRNDPEFKLSSDNSCKIKYYRFIFKWSLAACILATFAMSLTTFMLIGYIIELDIANIISNSVREIIVMFASVLSLILFIKSAKLLARAKRENNKK